MAETLTILVLCNLPLEGQDANTIVDHIQAFQNYSQHKVRICSMLTYLPKNLCLSKFDVLVIHYSLSLLFPRYLNKHSKERIRAFDGLKMVFVQDEYRKINAMIEQIQYLKIDVLFTCFPEQEMDKIYTRKQLPNLSKYNTLTGYIPERLLAYEKLKQTQHRTLHVGYRARKLPFWYGELAFEKWDIVEKWHQHTHDAALKTDISYKETDRIYGQAWIDFLNNCKTTLGVESGASVMDFTGELEKRIDDYQIKYPHHSFSKVQKEFLLEHEGKYKLNQISPRCFEAIALKTVLVLYEGEYSHILIPGRHYIALKKDFTNVQAVLAQVNDDNFLQNMADRAYEEIALNAEYTYAGFIKKFDAITQLEFKKRDKTKTVLEYADEAYAKDIKSWMFSQKILLESMSLYRKLPFFVRLSIKMLVKQGCFFKSFVMGKRGSE